MHFRCPTQSGVKRTQIAFAGQTVIRFERRVRSIPVSPDIQNNRGQRYAWGAQDKKSYPAHWKRG